MRAAAKPLNLEDNPYMHNGSTAEALALVFIALVIIIIWIEIKNWLCK